MERSLVHSWFSAQSYSQHADWFHLRKTICLKEYSITYCLFSIQNFFYLSLFDLKTTLAKRRNVETSKRRNVVDIFLICFYEIFIAIFYRLMLIRFKTKENCGQYVKNFWMRLLLFYQTRWPLSYSTLWIPIFCCYILKEIYGVEEWEYLNPNKSLQLLLSLVGCSPSCIKTS